MKFADWFLLYVIMLCSMSSCIDQSEMRKDVRAMRSLFETASTPQTTTKGQDPQ